MDQNFHQIKSLLDVVGRFSVLVYRSLLCASYSFPPFKFSYDVAFVNPANPDSVANGMQENNWSNDLFPRNIRDFANAQGITGCRIILPRKEDSLR
jgi:hypothetical protein